MNLRNGRCLLCSLFVIGARQFSESRSTQNGRHKWLQGSFALSGTVLPRAIEHLLAEPLAIVTISLTARADAKASFTGRLLMVTSAPDILASPHSSALNWRLRSLGAPWSR